MKFEILYNNVCRVRDSNSKVLVFGTKADAKKWITKNIDESFLRKRYVIRSVQ